MSSRPSAFHLAKSSLSICDTKAAMLARQHLPHRKHSPCDDALESFMIA
jgi:hypothetical protein